MCAYSKHFLLCKYFTAISVASSVQVTLQLIYINIIHIYIYGYLSVRALGSIFFQAKEETQRVEV